MTFTDGTAFRTESIRYLVVRMDGFKLEGGGGFLVLLEFF